MVCSGLDHSNIPNLDCMPQKIKQSNMKQKLTIDDKITIEGLEQLGFKPEGESLMVYAAYDVYIEIDCKNKDKNGWYLVSLGKTRIEKKELGVASTYKSIKAYMSIYDMDFAQTFRGRFKSTRIYDSLLQHSEESKEDLLKWIHKNSDNIRQILCISECSFSCTVWYEEFNNPET